MGTPNTVYVFVSKETERLCLRAYQLALGNTEYRDSNIYETNIDLLKEHVRYMKNEADKQRAAKTIKHLETLWLGDYCGIS